MLRPGVVCAPSRLGGQKYVLEGRQELVLSINLVVSFVEAHDFPSRFGEKKGEGSSSLSRKTTYLYRRSGSEEQ
jgi:hypothetical protein